MKRWLLTGASGILGSYLLPQLRDKPVVAWKGRTQVDLTDEEAVRRKFEEADPQIVIHAGAMSRVDDCFKNPDQADRVNHQATALLSRLCASRGSRLVHISTDMVFSGKSAPYRESDLPEPLSIYGKTKALAEKTLAPDRDQLIIRISLLFGPSRIPGQASFLDMIHRCLQEKRPLKLFEDEWRTILDLETASKVLVRLAESDCTGIIHLGGRERMSRLEMGMRLARFLGMDASCLFASSRVDSPTAEPRPCDLSLNCQRLHSIFPDLSFPDYETALGGLGLSRSSRVL